MAIKVKLLTTYESWDDPPQINLEGYGKSSFFSVHKYYFKYELFFIALLNYVKLRGRLIYKYYTWR